MGLADPRGLEHWGGQVQQGTLGMAPILQWPHTVTGAGPGQ